jgi:hypothetical protein
MRAPRRVVISAEFPKRRLLGKWNFAESVTDNMVEEAAQTASTMEIESLRPKAQIIV